MKRETIDKIKIRIVIGVVFICLGSVLIYMFFSVWDLDRNINFCEDRGYDRFDNSMKNSGTIYVRCCDTIIMEDDFGEECKLFQLT